MEKSELTVDTLPALEIIGQYMLRDGYDLLADFRKSHGVHLYDKKTEEYYLDFFSCYATMPLGYNHPRLTTPERIEELGWAAVQKPSNSDVYSQEMASFVQAMGRVGTTGDLKYMFFIEGGALAVENALKTAFDWKVRQNLDAGKGVLGHKVIHFREAFHGRSGYTLSLTNTSDPRKTQYFPTFDWPRILNPKCRFPLEGDNLDRVVKLEQEAVQQIEKALEAYGDDIACLIIEPMQSEGGDHHFRPEFHQQLREICNRHRILFIYDEVQTGFGASGRMWAFEHYQEPDIVCFGKKSQVCGIMVGSRVDDVKENVFKVSSRINSTWGGNLVDMVRSRMHLEIYEEDNIIEKAGRTGRYLLARLQELQSDFPALVSNVRGLGLLCAFDLPDPGVRDRLIQELFRNRLIILGCGDQSIRFRTALTILEEEIDRGIAIIRRALKSL